ncbi:MAG: DegT/DnrJ/EryC1/StrS family aminotransferase, partial [Armatimonadota bacterium]|nr:DegT/DnrJ/EryC1/StrS family aminotransferase [Armatimonadota bacterium]
DALLLALRALDIGPGDEVITTPFTFGATAETICLAGATPVFADIDPATFNLDPEKAAAKISPKTKAIMPVHLFGQIAPMDDFARIAQAHDLAIVGDAAQAIGAAQQGRPLGAWGDLNTLSFYPTKNLGACGDGGMVLTDSAELAARVRRLRNHGSTQYAHYDEIGYCSRLDGMQAAFLRVKLPHLKEWNEARRRHAAVYGAALGGLSDRLRLPCASAENFHIYHQYTVRVLNGQRDALAAFLAEHGVRTAVYYPLSLHLQPPYADLGYREGDLPESERASQEVLSLPVHPELSPDQIAYAAETVRAFFDK